MQNTNSTKRLRRTRPLFFHNGQCYFSKNNQVGFLREDRWINEFSFDCSLRNKFLSYSRLFYRLTRSGIYSAINHNGKFFIAYNRKLFLFDSVSGILSESMILPRGRGPLHFGDMSRLSGFGNEPVFGEYFGNNNKDPVSLYQHSPLGQWNQIYQFEQGEINHVHNMVPDSIRNCVWILTGDFDNAAAIWQAQNGFKTIIPIARGDQIYRACIAFPIQDGLLYATDSQFIQNSLRLLRPFKGTWKSTHLVDLNGPVIHGCETPDYYIVSTSTEPEYAPKKNLAALIQRKQSPWIPENRCDIIAISKNDLSIRILASRDKDFWPFRLFQFGTITFPSGTSPTNTVYACNIATRTYDLSTEILDIEVP